VSATVSTAGPPAPGDFHAARVARLRDRLPTLGVDGYLVTHLPNVRYLTGFSGSSGMLLVAAPGARFITDFRYEEQSKEEVRSAVTMIAPGPYRDIAAEVARAWGLGRIGFEAPHLVVKAYQELREALGSGVDLVPCEDETGVLRRIKGPEEVAAIERAVMLTARVFDAVLPEIRPGAREADLAAEIEHRMRREGAEEASFPTIVASGWRAALPHGRASAKRLEPGEFVVVDMGARLDGYCSDMTRTVCVGAPSEDARMIYEVVRQAQARCEEGARPGMTAREVDALARSVIEEAGYGRLFGHGTGHGVGIEVHEEPRLSAKAEEGMRVEAGSVFTVEPGIYVPGLGGVRIEDIVVMEEHGARVLTPNPKELLCL